MNKQQAKNYLKERLTEEKKRRKNTIFQVFAIIFIFVALTMTSFIVIVSKFYPITMNNMLGTPIFDLYAMYGRNDSVVVDITNFCNFNMTSKEQVECVVSQVNSFFNYSKDERGGYVVKSAEMIKESGGICRDYAVMYDSIFTNLGYDTNYAFTNDHVFNIIYDYSRNDIIYCVVDQNLFDC